MPWLHRRIGLQEESGLEGARALKKRSSSLASELLVVENAVSDARLGHDEAAKATIRVGIGELATDGGHVDMEVVILRSRTRFPTPPAAAARGWRYARDGP